MTAQAQTKRGVHKTSQKKSIFRNSGHSSDSGKAELINIANKMLKANLSNTFVVKALQTAFKFEGVADLMHIWVEEKDSKERDLVVADIQDMIDACVQNKKPEKIYVKFNDLDAIAKDIRAFKDSLFQEVMKRGGISKLSELTGIPQPSLSRFFNSNAMPQRATVLTIAKALDLTKLPIDMKWSNYHE